MNFMSTTYFIFGFLQAVTGYAAWVFYEQEHFNVNESDYKNIGTNPEIAVIYFSRMGYTKKIASEEADRTGACIYEIKSTERTEGTLGFWWCGRFGMHRRAMPTKDIECDISKFSHVTICSPIWVFSLAAPVRDFCQKSNGKIKEADYILVHHMHKNFENAADEMDSLLGIRRTSFKSIQCKEGKFKK